MVDTSRIVGKTLNSRGLSINKEVIKIKTEKAIEIAKVISSKKLDMGTIIKTRTDMSPRANAISPRFRIELKLMDDVGAVVVTILSVP
jgi:hypothetical protein